MSIRKVKVDHLTTLPVWPDPSVWCEIWERKHLKCVLDCFALYILSKFNPKNKFKNVGIQLKTVTFVGTGK